MLTIRAMDKDYRKQADEPSEDAPDDTDFSQPLVPPPPPPPPRMPPSPPSAPHVVTDLLTATDDDKPDKPFPEGDLDHPIAVVEVYSSHGIEYLIMLISLGVVAVSLSSLLNAIVDLATTKSAGLIGTLFNPYAEAALIVGFPVFAYLFLRLEAREETDTTFLADVSRRRGIQLTLIISFLIAISELIGYIGSLLSSGSDSGSSGVFSPLATPGNGSSWGVNFLHAFINLAIAGTIFGYFWYKLHCKTGAGQ